MTYECGQLHGLLYREMAFPSGTFAVVKGAYEPVLPAMTMSSCTRVQVQMDNAFVGSSRSIGPSFSMLRLLNLRAMFSSVKELWIQQGTTG
jgi:hypothetical protein